MGTTGPHPQESPIKCFITTQSFGTFNLEFCVQQFSNKVLAIVTESGSPGTWFQVRKLEHAETSYDITTLFGAETPELVLTARVIAETVFGYIPAQPLILSINLTHHSKDTLTSICKHLTLAFSSNSSLLSSS